ncbi:MAG TPA: OsmC family peroxiredoxin [Nitrospirota bacterium]|nr:OsmC family peroxiredoxin [Nitrospirota bacterium]
MLVRTAEARWLGDVKTGKGRVKLGSDVFDGDFTLGSRFESAPGTNSEELLGAAQASCFNIALAKNLEQLGFAVQAIDTRASVSIDKVNNESKITSIEYNTEAKVMPHIDEVMLREQAELAVNHCPVSEALSGVSVIVNARRMMMAA